MEDRNKYMEKFKTKLEEWSSEIDRFETRARKAEAEARTRYENEILKLKEYYSEAKHKYKDIQRSTKDGWYDLKKDADQASAKFKELIDDYRNRNNL